MAKAMKKMPMKKMTMKKQVKPMKTATSSTKVMKAVKTKAMPMKTKALQKKLNPMKKTTSPMKVMKAIEMNENEKKQWLVDMSESHDEWLDVSSYNASFHTKSPCSFKKWIQMCMEERGWVLVKKKSWASTAGWKKQS